MQAIKGAKRELRGTVIQERSKGIRCGRLFLAWELNSPEIP